MIPLADLLAQLEERTVPLPGVELPLEQAHGLRLATAAISTCDHPNAPISAMDGYAAAAADIRGGARLPLSATVPAGSQPAPLRPGTAVRIFTGAVLPDGADTVVKQEEADREGEEVVLPERARGWDVRRAGEVFREGQLVAEAGERLTAERMALLYTAGIEEVVVHPPVEVAVLPTGSELLHPGQRGGPGMIRGGNGPMLAALVEEAGGRLALSEAVRDEEEELRRALAGASECSRLVLTTGGVSVGGKDLVPRTLQELGAEQIARGVGIKPGRPTMLAKLGDAWVLALPGHPISALVGWRMIGWRLLRRLAGERGALGEGHLSARLVNTARNRGGSPGFFPAKLERTSEGAVVHRLETRGPHDVLALARANSLVQVEPGQALEAGSLVPVHPFAPLERARTPQEEAHGGA